VKAYDLGAFGGANELENSFYAGRKARHLAWTGGGVKCGGKIRFGDARRGLP